jgi:hypothetical protein
MPKEKTLSSAPVRPVVQPSHTQPAQLEPLKFFVQLKGYGVVDGKDKTIMAIGQSGKRTIAPDDAPLALVVAILENWQNAWKYSSVEAAKADLDRLKRYVDSIEID